MAQQKMHPVSFSNSKSWLKRGKRLVALNPSRYYFWTDNPPCCLSNVLRLLCKRQTRCNRDRGQSLHVFATSLLGWCGGAELCVCLCARMRVYEHKSSKVWKASQVFNLKLCLIFLMYLLGAVCIQHSYVTEKASASVDYWVIYVLFFPMQV